MPQRLVIIGAGPAGMRAAEVLRQEAPEAEILLVGDEPHLPYDRPPLSKAFLTDGLAPPQLYLKPPSFYDEQRIALRLGVAATAIDRGAKRVALADGTSVAYDKLLLATGCCARCFPVDAEPSSILYLRSLADAEQLRARLRPGAAIVVIGGGFIGLEIAASATQLGAQVTVLEAAPRLLARSMPEIVSDFMRRLHEEHGVRFELGARLTQMAATDERALVATERAEYPCDVIIAGIGAAPNTRLAEAAGLIAEDGVRVDALGRTSDPDIFAAGDVTRHDNPLIGRAVRLESWQVALNQAAFVARAMLGAETPYAEMPWLWTDQYDCNIQVLGFVDPGMDFVRRGNPGARSFTLLGLDAQDRLATAITVNNGRDMSILRRLVALRASLPKDVLADPARKLADLLKAARAP